MFRFTANPRQNEELNFSCLVLNDLDELKTLKKISFGQLNLSSPEMNRKRRSKVKLSRYRPEQTLGVPAG
jgi:hypothetical protein